MAKHSSRKQRHGSGKRRRAAAPIAKQVAPRRPRTGNATLRRAVCCTACCTVLGLVMLSAIAPDVQAQLAAATAPPAPIHRDQPAYYQADTVTYDRGIGLVTLTGNVEFWQDDRILLADKVTYDRNTDVAAATGHVVLLEPDGQTVFSDYAELTGGMKDGILTDMRALLAQNGRLAANGGRRTDAHINELSRAVYSTCNLCAQDPTKPPLWQIRARSAVQDTENKMIEYHDAVVEMYGIPMLYTPYLSHPDPSAKRASGLLVPSFGYSSHLGAFASVPYYWVINNESDATITPTVASQNGPAMNLQYRQRFNNGTLTINTSLAYDRSDAGSGSEGGGSAGHVFAKGSFAINDTWRWGFDVNRASSEQYIRDFHVADAASILTSQVYLEGFGQGAYTKLDARAYQGLTTTVQQERLPYVLPHYQYYFTGQPDALGGRTTVDADAFNIVRFDGTSTERAHLGLNWDRAFTGRLGDQWMFTLHGDGAAYSAHGLERQPNFHVGADDANSAQGMPTAALKLNWPFVRNTEHWGTQLIEPIAQIIAAPNGSNYVNSVIPNEDSLDVEFTDAALFSLNRFSGVDRLEGGMRANVALHANWTFPSGGMVDGLVGQGYRLKKDNAFPTGSGLENTATDIVSHLSYSPNSYFDITSRQRFDHKTMNVRYLDAIASGGPQYLRISGGYLYTFNNPYTIFDNPGAQTVLTSPRNELSLSLHTKYGPWRLGLNGTRDLRTNKMISAGVDAAYDDECFTFDVSFSRRYTSIDNDNGDTTILFQLTFKTVGTFGFNAN